ncbi:hypothetical protein ACFUTX_10040 [Microbacterium sp. NPDC057407]|uniref:hypothetical protein n=1 Tax=Microbacterium sp. NPDC057407 TaxID=3346120 RepID=UPI003670246E
MPRARATSTESFAGLLDDLTEPEADMGAAQTDERSPSSAAKARTSAIASALRRNRGLWITAAVATVALTAGLLVGRFVVPQDVASAAPPDPGLVTVPVEYGELTNDVTIRGDFGYSDPVEMSIDTSALAGPAVVTGKVPEVGAELKPLDVVLELAGRPVIVLPGALPAYRDLRVGVSGPDVVQFKEAMRAVGLDAGDPQNDVFDGTTASALATLYAHAGYPPPETADDAADGVSAAEAGVRDAEVSLESARQDLEAARAGRSAVDIREADNAVNAARRELDAARAATPQDPVLIGNLADALALAELRREALNAAPDTRSQEAAVAAAETAVKDAQRSLERARQDALPFLPAGEVLYLTELPRRVDAVNAQRGSILENPAMTVSGATVAVTGSAAKADATLLKVGATAELELPEGGTHRAKVATITSPEEGERWSIVFEPEPLTDEQLLLLQGTNVRVKVPVSSTKGKVLSVPLAALTAGPAGESRLQVVDGDPRDGADADTRLVTVTTGLAADGIVEVTPVKGRLAQGDKVVIGR